MKYKEYLPNSEEYHMLHYMILFLGLSVFVLCFYFVSYFPLYQILVAGLSVMYYVVWGMLHHSLEGRLTKVVALEYVLFGIVAFLLLVSAIVV